MFIYQAPGNVGNVATTSSTASDSPLPASTSSNIAALQSLLTVSVCVGDVPVCRAGETNVDCLYLTYFLEEDKFASYNISKCFSAILTIDASRSGQCPGEVLIRQWRDV